MIRFRFGCIAATIAPYVIPTTDRTSSNGARSTAACGKNGIAKRKNPYAPIFSITPASTTEPAVGASVCASGNHVWNGKIGTLTAKPIAKATNNHLAVVSDIDEAVDDHAVSTR